jgi:hypothetical protein
MKNIRFLFSQENILKYVQVLLFTLSLIALIFCFNESLKLAFDISNNGFKNLLLVFKPYYPLFAATLVLTTARIALKSFIINSKNTWYNNIKEFFEIVKEENPIIIKDVIRNSDSIHYYLNSIGFKFRSKNELVDFMNKFFTKRIEIYEKMNIVLQEVNYYENADMSYSWDNFKYIIDVMINVENSYDNFEKDLKEMYMNEVKDFNTDLINEDMYLRKKREYNVRNFFGNAE